MTKKILIIALITLFVSCVLLIIVFELKYDKKFLPGVVIDGQSVGGKNYEEVLSFFQVKADFILKNGFTFNIETDRGVKAINVPAFFNGMTTDQVAEYFSLGDFKKVIEEAYKFGKYGSLWQKLKDRYVGLLHGKNFQFTTSVKKDLLENYASNELNKFLIKSEPAYFKYEGGEVVVVKEIIGEKIETSKFTQIILEKLSSLDMSEHNLEAEEDALFVTEDRLKTFINLADDLTSSVKLKLNYKDYYWTIKKEVFLSWLTLINEDSLGINKQKLINYLDRNVASFIDKPVQNSRFGVKDGKLVELFVGKHGNAMDVEKIAKNIEDSALSLDLTEQEESLVIIIPVETTIKDPAITQNTIMKYNIKESIGSATTNFESSSVDRKNNIKNGVSKLNGILLAPGEEFSAVKAIGEITEEAGFVKEFVISNGETKKELGGGLCQVATTLFRLALNAGLPITERANHRYVVSYYGPGLDATIYGPHPDLRFINDTKNYILLQGFVDDTKVVLELYGEKDGRLVEISEPLLYNWISPPPTKYVPNYELSPGQVKCTESAHNGVTAETNYTVQYPDGEIKVTNFKSIYQPWQKVCLLGIASH